MPMKAIADLRDVRDLVPHWRVEIRYLLMHLPPVRADRSPSVLPGGFDWEYLLATASQHGVLPLFVDSVSRQDRPAIPEVVLKRARRECSVVAQRNFIFAQELLRLIAHLHAHEVDVVPYKGASLAEMAYGDLSLRQFSDLDILVRSTDVLRARGLLEELGYRARFIYGRRPLTSLTAPETRNFLKYRHEFEMQREDGLLVDLHWQLAPRHYPFRLDPAPLWDRMESTVLAGRSIPSFAREDLILVLCMHGAKDSWEKLVWILDLARIITNARELDWDAIERDARDARMELPLLLGLRLVESLCAVEIPSLSDRDPDSRIDGLARSVFERLFREHREPERFPVKALHLGLCRNAGDRLSYTIQALFVPRLGEWAMLRLPAWAFPLYYVLRPLRILAGWSLSRIRRKIAAAGRRS
ncbi:nucleotidyltransferase family protein [soil metagenome]